MKRENYVSLYKSKKTSVYLKRKKTRYVITHKPLNITPEKTLFIYLFISALTLTTPATQIKQQNASQG